MYPQIGVSLENRKAEVRRVGDAIQKASCVVVAGGGPIGLELVGDIRAEYPTKKVVLLCRNGVLSAWPDKQRQKVEAQLKIMNIEVVNGNFNSPAEPNLQSGILKSDQMELAYDVFLPAYSFGPNTKFLEDTGVLDGSNNIDVNEYLQCKTCKEMFAVGVSNVKEPFIGFVKLEAQWTSVANNVAAFLSEKSLKAHKEGMPFMKLPPAILIGHGPKGYGFFDFNNMPPPIKCCCCGGLGGWPCCPPCWPCCACAGCGCCPCGICCGPPEGAGVAKLASVMGFKIANLHFKGMSEAPAQQHM